MMRKHWRYIAAVSLLSAVMITGCGDGSEAQESSITVLEPVVVTNPPVNAEPKPETDSPAEIKLLHSTGSLGEETEAALLDTMTTLYQNLELPEYVGEGIHMVSNENWVQTVAADLCEGGRNYTLQKGEEILLTMYVGMDIEGELFVHVFFQGTENDVILLKQEKGITWLLQAAISEGKYDGAFEKWQIDSKAGHIQKEEGTYSSGVIVGEYTKSEYKGDPGDAFDLWTNREGFVYETVTETYDEQGELIPTPTPVPTTTPAPKPAANNTPAPKPAGNNTPAPTAAPTQNPEPEPNNPQPDNPAPTPAPEPTPAPTPEPTPEPTPTPSTGDTDIDYGDWSQDLDV